MSPVPNRSPRQPRWLIVLLLALALAALAATAVYNGLGQLGNAPLTIVVDGQEIGHGIGLDGLAPVHRAMAAGGVVFGLLVAAVALPLALLLVASVLVVVVMGVVVAVVGMPLLVVCLVMLPLCSPLLLLCLLLWWLLREPRPRRPTGG